jgi:hypothetical protein
VTVRFPHYRVAIDLVGAHEGSGKTANPREDSRKATGSGGVADRDPTTWPHGRGAAAGPATAADSISPAPGADAARPHIELAPRTPGTLGRRPEGGDAPTSPS